MNHIMCLLTQARFVASGGLQPLVDLLKKEESLRTKGIAIGAIGMVTNTDSARVRLNTLGLVYIRVSNRVSIY